MENKKKEFEKPEVVTYSEKETIEIKGEQSCSDRSILVGDMCN